MERTAKVLEDSLLVIWNERDAAKRLALMKDVYSEAIAFYETHDGPKIRGHHGINALINSLQSQWPAEFKFVLSAPSKENHQIQVVFWTLGIPGQAPAASGMDVAIVEGGKIVSLHLFLDGVGK